MPNVVSFPKLGLSFTLNRAALKIGGFEIYWYGVLIALGLLLAIIYGIYESKKVKLDADDLFNMIIIALPVAIICARAYYVIFSWDSYRSDLMSVFDIRSGGLAIYGGIIGAALVVILYCRKKKISIGVVLDILAIGLLIGQVVGRWGNFVNGEAFGSTTNLPWAMTIKSDGEIVAKSVHPTFLYESIWNFVGIIAILAYKKLRKFNGELFCCYLVWYGAGRALIEGLRADSLYIGNVRVSQLLAVGCFIIGIILIIYNRYIRTKTGND